jgi:hypothetical protein
MDAQKQKMLDAIHHPKRLFRRVEFEPSDHPNTLEAIFKPMGIIGIKPRLYK